MGLGSVRQDILERFHRIEVAGPTGRLNPNRRKDYETLPVRTVG